MLDTIEIEIPQLTVEIKFSPSGYNRYVLEHIKDDNTYLWSYLREMNINFAVRHANLNEIIQSIFLNHVSNIDKRQNDDYYPLDNDHFQELNQIETVCLTIHKYTQELIDIIYFMDFLKVNNRFPSEIDRKKKVEGLFVNSLFKIRLENHVDYLNSIEKIYDSYKNFFIHPFTDCMLLENEPMIFIKQQRDFIFSDIQKKPMNELINQYKLFFLESKEILRICSPQAISIGF